MRLACRTARSMLWLSVQVVSELRKREEELAKEKKEKEQLAKKLQVRTCEYWTSPRSTPLAYPGPVRQMRAYRTHQPTSTARVRMRQAVMVPLTAGDGGEADRRRHAHRRPSRAAGWSGSASAARPCRTQSGAVSRIGSAAQTSISDLGLKFGHNGVL